MAKEFFEGKRFKAETISMIALVDTILDDYRDQGYDLSLRQLYYQLVSRDVIPNTLESYTRLGRIVSDARLAGLIDWDMIVDRGRKTERNNHWDSPGEIIRSASNQFRIDKWADQPCHVEVMVEKQALEGVLIPVCQRLDVNFTANKGYSSQSMMYEMGKRLEERHEDGKQVVILYLGDHDPSGLDMDRDIGKRLSLFSGIPVRSERLALMFEQIEELRPPKNPAKMTDSRAKNYVKLYGYSSWELDAVEPKELDRLVTVAVLEVRDPGPWDDACAREDEMRADLERFAEEYDG